MTKSWKKKVQPPKLQRDRTAVYLQERTIKDGSGRRVYSMSVPRWAVKKLGVKSGQGFLVEVESPSTTRRGYDLLTFTVAGDMLSPRRRSVKQFWDKVQD